jgi:hypothetical protein
MAPAPSRVPPSRTLGNRLTKTSVTGLRTTGYVVTRVPAGTVGPRPAFRRPRLASPATPRHRRRARRAGSARALGTASPSSRIRMHPRRRFIGALISLSTLLYVELVSGAALAMWVLARWPRLGPKRMVSAVGVLLITLFLGQVVSAGVTAALRLPHGLYAALFGCVLPVFVSIFLAAGWLLRSLLSTIGGGSGGTGHRAPGRS